MAPNILSTTSPIMDLETGISQPRAEVPGNRDAYIGPRQSVLQRAYSIWETEGRPGNHALSNWLAAEGELQPGAPSPVRAIPTVDPAADEEWRYGPFTAKAHAPGFDRPAPEGSVVPLPNGVGDDVRDYAFHLYVQGGCEQTGKAECWREASRCLNRRLPPPPLRTTKTKTEFNRLRRFGQ